MRYTVSGLIWLLFPALVAAQAKPLLVPNTEGHTARVTRVRFTPDGRQLVSVSQDKTIRIWDVKSGQTVRVLRPPIGPGPEGMLAALAIAPDGKTIAVGGYPVGGGRFHVPIYLIDLPTGRIVRLLHGHKSSITDLAFSPDGKRLASTSYDKTLRIWDIGSEEKEKILEGHEHFINGVAWSPDGKHLATASFDRTGRIWSAADGQCDAVLKGHTREVHCVAWSRDGKWIATGGEDRSVRMWTADGKPGRVFPNLGNRITSLTFTRLSKALVVTRGSPDSLDHTCSVLWHGPGEERVKFTKHTDTVTNGTLSLDGRLAATCGGFSHEIYIWQIADGALWNRLGSRSRGMMSAAWDRTGTLIAWGNSNKGSTLQANLPLERTFRPANLESGGPPDATFRRAELARGSLSLALKSSNAVDLRLGGEVVQTFKLFGAGNRVRCFSFLTADRVVVGGTNSVELFDATTGKCILILHGHSDEVWAVAPAPDRRFLLTASLDQTVRVWDAEALLRPETTGIGLTLRIEQGLPVVSGILVGSPAALDGRLREGDRLTDVASRGSKFVSVKGRKINEVLGLINGPAGSTVRLRVLPAEKTDSVDYEIERKRPANWIGRIEPLFSLFVNDKDWMAWTPEGYYAASPGGETMMGWHINNGIDKMATFLPAERFSRSLNRPDILMQALETGSVDRARSLADLIRGFRTEPVNIVQILPARVKITAPSKSGTKVDEEELEVSAAAESTGKYPVTAMRLLLDGRPFQGLKGIKRFQSNDPGSVKASWNVRLTSGRHRLVVLADSAVSQGSSEPIEVSYVVDSPPPQGRLFVLAVGIANYKDPNLKLYYGASDARSIVQRLKEKSTPFPYQKVEPWVLADLKATRKAIREGFAWLQKEMKPNDSACVFYSGHGERGPSGGLYLLPADVDVKDLEKTAISGEELKAALVGLPGQVLLILDACHSGALGRGRPLSNPVTNDLAKDLGREENGILVMCSSKSRHPSIENNESQHSFYTQALLEGLAGKGSTAANDGIVYQLRLNTYAIERVLALSKKAQEPTQNFPQDVSRFPLTRP